VYPSGVPSEDPALAEERRSTEAALAAQLTAATAGGARAVLVAGNHDWEYGQPGVDRQADMAREYSGDVSFMPEPGNPGPVVVDVSDEIRLVALDTEWWIRAEFEPADVSRFRADLTSAMLGAGDRRVIVIAHHPIASHGPHGGFYDLEKRFGGPVPSPIVGGLIGAAIGGALSLVKGEFWPLPFALYGVGLAAYMPTDANFTLLHGIASGGQDIHTPPYQRMLSVFRSVFATHRPFVYASGHEHVLEVLDGGEMADYLLVSGAGSKNSPVKHGARTLFDAYGEGFMVLDFLNDGSVTLRVITTDDGPEEGAVAFTMDLDG
jgi:hypothetical protein